ncbi:MAG: hypothetical protein K1X54_13070 [Flavobacteriales bacterium]|nr:hypothetical protein [Flavobacteriales bacterium]
MTKKASLIYLSIAPVLFALSWYISHRMYTDFLQNGVGNMEYGGKERSFTYAASFTILYLAAYLVIKDLYKKKK